MEVGTFSIPNMRLFPNLIAYVKKMYNKFESREVDYDTLAPLFGHKTSKSGAFTPKIRCMKAYNLIDGRGKVRVTETGRKIALPKDSEEENAGIIEAITSVQLWKELYEKYTKVGEDLPTSDFWIDLRQICGITPEEAQRKTNWVRKAFLDDAIHINVKKQDESDKMDNQNHDSFKNQPLGAAELISFDGGALKLFLPKENLRESWEKVKQMIDIYLGINSEQGKTA